jgi:hypothetical protein
MYVYIYKPMLTDFNYFIISISFLILLKSEKEIVFLLKTLTAKISLVYLFLHL